MTCGIGSNIDPLAALGLPKVRQLVFYEADQKTGRQVGGYFTYDKNPQKINAAFKIIKDNKAYGKRAIGLSNLRITKESYLDLFKKTDYPKAVKDAEKFFTHLPANALYKSFQVLPKNIQWALIDMSFNLGAHKLAKYGAFHVNSFKQLLGYGNFKEAARHSFRHGGLQPSRNKTIHDWIAMYSIPKAR